MRSACCQAGSRQTAAARMASTVLFATPQGYAVIETVQPSANSVFCDDYDPNALALDEACRRLLGAMPAPRGSERLALRDALGRVLACDLHAPFDIPAHRSSAMDGYAMRMADQQRPDAAHTVGLPVVGTSAAGHPYAGALPTGAAIRIMTGAVVPAEADAVIMQEHVERTGDTIRFTPDRAPRAGANIRLAGEDLRAGARALAAGRRIRPADLGLAASLGLAEVMVRPRLRVAFFSTGDELCSIGERPAIGQVFDSNRYTLYGMLAKLGVDIHDLGVVRDTPAALQEAFEQAVGCADVVLSSGGVSVGDADFVRTMLDSMGKTVFWKINVKPGRPFAYGQLTGNCHFFGLPGNPVAVMVTFHQIVRPALLRLMGVDPLPRDLRVQARTLAALKKAPGRFEYQRGVLDLAADGSWQVDPTGEQSSGMLSSMSLANCFICLPENVGKLEAGALVEVLPFDEGL